MTPAPWATLTLLSLSLGASCSCEDDQFVAGTSAIIASPVRVDLGRVFVGASAVMQVDLSARGAVPVTFSASYASGDPSGFRSGPASGVIPAGRQLALTVLFTPRVAGAREATIRLVHDAADTPDDVVIEIAAVAIEVPDCEDGNGCTIDTFDLDAGVCRHEATSSPCDDFNACTKGDTCVDALCRGESVLCDDGNSCTDDVCDRQQGCLHIPTRSCDDGNPCTQDMCDSDGCRHVDLEDGTPCNDLLQCTVGDICLLGQCRGVRAENGTVCDDGDPCSLMDQCVDGVCTDPDYDRPNPGELKFATRVGILAPGSANNPIVDRDSTVFAGVHTGVVAVDQCGVVLWRNDSLGEPNFGAAVSLPGILSVPFDGVLVDLETQSGTELGRIDLTGSLPASVETASTATVSVRVVDLAVRASGGLVASMTRTISDPPHFEGWLAEVDPTHSIATLYRRLGVRYARRLAIDLDESVIALVAEPLDDLVSEQQVVRFGPDGLPDLTWSSSARRAVHTDLALGADGEVLWTAGLIELSRTGTATQRFSPPSAPLALEAGSPALHRAQIHFVIREEAPPEASRSALPGGYFSLVAQSSTTAETLWRVELPARAVQASPVVDALGHVFLALEDGRVVGFEPNGRLLMQLQLPLETAVDEPIALTLTPERVLVVTTQETVFAVQVLGGLSASPWPRHRRDNLSTGHR